MKHTSELKHRMLMGRWTARPVACVTSKKKKCNSARRARKYMNAYCRANMKGRSKHVADFPRRRDVQHKTQNNSLQNKKGQRWHLKMSSKNVYNQFGEHKIRKNRKSVRHSRREIRFRRGGKRTLYVSFNVGRSGVTSSLPWKANIENKVSGGPTNILTSYPKQRIHQKQRQQKIRNHTIHTQNPNILLIFPKPSHI